MKRFMIRGLRVEMTITYSLTLNENGMMVWLLYNAPNVMLRCSNLTVKNQITDTEELGNVTRSFKPLKAVRVTIWGLCQNPHQITFKPLKKLKIWRYHYIETIPILQSFPGVILFNEIPNCQITGTDRYIPFPIR